jgi:hypothetical protein
MTAHLRPLLRIAAASALMVGAGLVGSCATPAPVVEPTEPADPFGRPRLPRSSAGAASDSADAKPAGAAELERTEVDAFLANGPGWFIRQVSMEPAHLGDKFVGFRIVRFFDGDPRFSAVDIRPGDVVIRINDLPIGKPDQFMKAWEDIKAARKLNVEYVRGGSVRLLEWDIVDESEIQPQIVTGGG